MKGKLVFGIMITLLLESLFFSVIIVVKGGIEEHDLVISWEKPILSERNHFINGTSIVLNATVFNNGSSTENVALELLINSTSVLYSSAFNLAPGNFFWSAYYWTPEEGDYYVTAYTPPVENETSVENNNDTRWVRVCPNQPPMANFTFEPEFEPNVVLIGENVTFDASASHDDFDWGKIENYYWNFDDDTSIINITDPTINHTYTSPKTYNVTLTVVDNRGLNDSTWQLVTVEKKPIASFTVSAGHEYGEGPPPYYVNDTLTFNASGSQPNGGEIVWYLWNFSDGTLPQNKTIPTIVHTYTTPGEYCVNLTIADNNTLTDSHNRTIDIAIGFPVANFTILSSPPYYVNTTLAFNAKDSYDSDWGDVIWYHWDFGDDTPVDNTTAKTAFHEYMSEGDFTVSLTVTDNESLTSRPFNMTVSVSFLALLKVEPQVVPTNPGYMALNISIDIENVKDLKTALFRLTWSSEWLPPTWPILLGIDSSPDEGSFLGPRFFGGEGPRWNVRYNLDENEGFIFVNCTFFTDIVPIENRTGSGTLVNILLTVETSGNSSLTLTDITLLNSTNDPIPYEVEQGYFYTSRPVANFIYSPRPILPNQTVTFNASLSYDPDNPYDPSPGPIASYTWDFNDGTNDTGMIVTHNFTHGNFEVNLTVTDDDEETWWITYLVPATDVSLNVTPCWRAFNETLNLYETAGILPINVTIVNNGVQIENFTVKVYANDTSIENKTVPVPAGGSKTISFSLFASELQKGDYNISVRVAGNIEYADYLVRVYLAGDVDRDDDVDIFDIVTICNLYGINEGDPQWEENPQYMRKCDLNCDGKIDIYDIVIACGNYGGVAPLF